MRYFSRAFSTAYLSTLLFTQVAIADDSAWKATVEKASQSILSLEIDLDRSFNESWNTSTIATGFIVDSLQGIVLTNRHVITAGPITAFATFANGERIELQPLYRDPVHDFAFFKYDPASLKFNKPDGLQLKPEMVREGLEIRVIGNDAGERNAILPGIIARLDRNAPGYGRGRFNDFNTFYFQSGSMTSGGSSGSPVLNNDGHVVALNAGGSNNAASAYFLPLDRIVPTLNKLQQNAEIQRGSLDTLFRHVPFDRLAKLGLPSDIEAAARKTNSNVSGMLVVADTLPGGNAEGKVRAGDIVHSLQGKLLTSFTELSEVVDNSIGKEVSLGVVRNGQPLSVSIVASDLAEYDQTSFIEIGGSLLHTPPISDAWFSRRPKLGVYVADPGYLLRGEPVQKGDVIAQIGSAKVNSIGDAKDALTGLGENQRTVVQFYNLAEPRIPGTATLTMNSKWSENRVCERKGRPEVWHCEELEIKQATTLTTDAALEKPLAPNSESLLSSLVHIRYKSPYSIAGYTNSHTVSYEGTGIILDAAQGLVATDRNTVIHSLGDVNLTFGGSITIPATVWHLNPLHNIALLRYDPALVVKVPTKSLPLNDRLPQDDEELFIQGIDQFGAIKTARARVSDVQSIPYGIPEGYFFHDTMGIVINLDDTMGDLNGALVDAKGNALGLWSTFGYLSRGRLEQTVAGIPSHYLLSTMRHAKEQTPYQRFSAQLKVAPLSEAIALGLPAAYAEQLSQKPFRGRRQVLQVGHSSATQTNQTPLLPGDLLLTVNGKPVTDFMQFEEAVETGSINLELWRDGAVVKADVTPAPLLGESVSKVLLWQGAVLHDPHRELADLQGIPSQGVYVNLTYNGSPGGRQGLGGQIVSLNDKPTPTLLDFIAELKSLNPTAVVIVRTIDSSGRERTHAIEPRMEMWPTILLTKVDDGAWEKSDPIISS